ncbi:hypothetical protein ABZ714_14290 [Streptomyces sp. NPDC006798]|uniref:hypothetical protein n=1 Tax=unclassified Streptomyces TaxID=2593676 RepID=UPI0033F0A41E
MTYKDYDSDIIFSRGEATTNAAKMLAGIHALDDEVLEVVYSRTKAERRERGKGSDDDDSMVWAHTGPYSDENELVEGCLYVYAAGRIAVLNPRHLVNSTSRIAEMVFEGNAEITYAAALSLREKVEKAIGEALGREGTIS